MLHTSNFPYTPLPRHIIIIQKLEIYILLKLERRLFVDSNPLFYDTMGGSIAVAEIFIL